MPPKKGKKGTQKNRPAPAPAPMATPIPAPPPVSNRLARITLPNRQPPRATANNLKRHYTELLSNPAEFDTAKALFGRLGEVNPKAQENILDISKAIRNAAIAARNEDTLEQYNKILEPHKFISDRGILDAHSFYYKQIDLDPIGKQFYNVEREVYVNIISLFIRVLNYYFQDVKFIRLFPTMIDEAKKSITSLNTFKTTYTGTNVIEQYNKKVVSEYTAKLRALFETGFAELNAALNGKDDEHVMLRLQLFILDLFKTLIQEIKVQTELGVLGRFRDNEIHIAYYIMKDFLSTAMQDIIPPYKDELIPQILEEREAERKRMEFNLQQKEKHRLLEAQRLINEEKKRVALLKEAELANQRARNLIEQNELERAALAARTAQATVRSANRNNVSIVSSTLRTLGLLSTPQEEEEPVVVPQPVPVAAAAVPVASVIEPSSQNLQSLLSSVKEFKRKYTHLSMADIMAALKAINSNNNNEQWETVDQQLKLSPVKLLEPALIAARDRQQLPRPLLSLIQEFTPEQLANHLKAQLPVLQAAVGDSTLIFTVNHTSDSVYINIFKDRGAGGGAGGGQIAHISFHLNVDERYNRAEWGHIHIKEDGLEQDDAGYVFNISYSPSYRFTPGDTIGSPSTLTTQLANAFSSLILPSAGATVRKPALKTGSSTNSTNSTRKKGGYRRKTRRRLA